MRPLELVGRLAMDDEPDEARASLEEAERLARRSLDEVRATVGMVRAASNDVAPLPGAADLAALVESFRRAGTVVDLDLEGDASALLGEGTVKTHVGHVFAELGLRDRAAAVVWAFDHRLVRPGAR